jgi:hypothetical protein
VVNVFNLLLEHAGAEHMLPVPLEFQHLLHDSLNALLALQSHPALMSVALPGCDAIANVPVRRYGIPNAEPVQSDGQCIPPLVMARLNQLLSVRMAVCNGGVQAMPWLPMWSLLLHGSERELRPDILDPLRLGWLLDDARWDQMPVLHNLAYWVTMGCEQSVTHNEVRWLFHPNFGTVMASARCSSWCLRPGSVLLPNTRACNVPRSFDNLWHCITQLQRKYRPDLTLPSPDGIYPRFLTLWQRDAGGDQDVQLAMRLDVPACAPSRASPPECLHPHHGQAVVHSSAMHEAVSRARLMYGGGN